MLEDCAITGKVNQKWIHEWTEDASTLKETIIHAMNDLFRLDLQTVSEHYTGENFGKKVCHRLTYRSKDSKSFQVFLLWKKN